jgi:hypothetical protein
MYTVYVDSEMSALYNFVFYIYNIRGTTLRIEQLCFYFKGLHYKSVNMIMFKSQMN